MTDSNRSARNAYLRAWRQRRRYRGLNARGIPYFEGDVCEHCGEFFRHPGLGRHRQACAKRRAA